jgi:hypothetical protein
MLNSVNQTPGSAISWGLAMDNPPIAENINCRQKIFPAIGWLSSKRQFATPAAGCSWGYGGAQRKKVAAGVRSNAHVSDMDIAMDRPR